MVMRILRAGFYHASMTDSKGWFFNQLEENDPDRLARRAATLAIVTAPPEPSTGFASVADASRAAGAAVAALLKAGDAAGARRATIEFVVRKFRPGFVATDAFIADLDSYHSVLSPSWRLLSPLHWHWQAAAKERVLTAVGGNFEVVHHAMAASSGLFERAAAVATPKYGASLRARAAASAGGAFPVLAAFDEAEPQQNFLVVKASAAGTTLGGLAPRPMAAGELVMLQLAGTPYSDARFQACSGQRLLTDFMEGVIGAFYPDVPLRPAAFAPVPLYPEVAAALGRSDAKAPAGASVASPAASSEPASAAL
jgi:hypothetical protein